MIYMRNITITTAKSATYLENVGGRGLRHRPRWCGAQAWRAWKLEPFRCPEIDLECPGPRMACRVASRLSPDPGGIADRKAASGRPVSFPVLLHRHVCPFRGVPADAQARPGISGRPDASRERVRPGSRNPAARQKGAASAPGAAQTQKGRPAHHPGGSRHPFQPASAPSAGTGRGRPSSSRATKVKTASVTRLRSSLCRSRRQASTRMRSEVRPTERICA